MQAREESSAQTTRRCGVNRTLIDGFGDRCPTVGRRTLIVGGLETSILPFNYGPNPNKSWNVIRETRKRSHNVEIALQFLTLCTYPELNGDRRLRKPLLYPIKL